MSAPTPTEVPSADPSLTIPPAGAESKSAQKRAAKAAEKAAEKAEKDKIKAAKAASEPGQREDGARPAPAA